MYLLFLSLVIFLFNQLCYYVFFLFNSLDIKRALLLRNFKKNGIIAGTGNKTGRNLLFECMNIKHAMNCRLQKRIFVGS